MLIAPLAPAAALHLVIITLHSLPSKVPNLKSRSCENVFTNFLGILKSFYISASAHHSMSQQRNTDKSMASTVYKVFFPSTERTWIYLKISNHVTYIYARSFNQGENEENWIYVSLKLLIPLKYFWTPPLKFVFSQLCPVASVGSAGPAFSTGRASLDPTVQTAHCTVY